MSAGIPLPPADITRWTRHRKEHARQIAIWEDDLAAAQRDYVGLTGEPPPQTPDTMRALITDVAGRALTNWPRTTKTDQLSIKIKYLKRLRDVPAVRAVLAIRSSQSLLANFGERLRQHINPGTGRLHARYDIAGAKSGRFTCQDPNLQNLPKNRAPEFRSCIVAAPGYVLVDADWSQIELRVAAWLHGDPVLTAAFAAGRDIHTATAGMIAGIPIDEVNTEQRQCAKAINFGTIYGIGPRALADNIFGDYGIVLTIAEARQALDRFKQTYPVLHSNQQVQSAISQRRNYIDIGAGRRVWGSDQPGGRLSHPQCSNLPVQGLAADCMLRALPLVDQRLAGLDAGLVGCVHDELLVEAAEKDAETVARILKDTMIEAFEATCPGAPTRNLVEVGIGRTWRDAKP